MQGRKHLRIYTIINGPLSHLTRLQMWISVYHWGCVNKRASSFVAVMVVVISTCDVFLSSKVQATVNCVSHFSVRVSVIWSPRTDVDNLIVEKIVRLNFRAATLCNTLWGFDLRVSGRDSSKSPQSHPTRWLRQVKTTWPFKFRFL